MACGTHTPNTAHPGTVSEQLRVGFLAEGYPLLTDSFSLPGLIEVYPHPALLALMQADYRLPYKFSKRRRYWPERLPFERRERLIGEWASIVAALDKQIAGTASMLVPPQTDSRNYVLKGFEDALDAVICAWVGICALDGHAEPFGDKESAIWIPRRAVAASGGVVQHADQNIRGSGTGGARNPA
jgi:predicted RNase H-like nuclease